MKLRKPNRLRNRKGKWNIYYNEVDLWLMPDRRKQIDIVKEQLDEINFQPVGVAEIVQASG